MTKIRWRWEERDFGFRFRTGRGQSTAEHYQASLPDEFYLVPPGQRKLKKPEIDELALTAAIPIGPKVVANPWQNYERDWDWIESTDGICLNFAGCLHQDEIDRREDEGVARAREFIVGLLERSDPVPVTVTLVQQIHRELMGEIYPFAGKWRTVALHKGDGPTKWPLPMTGIGTLMEVFENETLRKTPFISDNADAVYLLVSEIMNEMLAVHPFREGNGRSAFIVGDLILMQNDLLPLSEYDEHRHQAPYYAACEAGRLQKDYEPLKKLIAEWEEEALARWERENG